MFHPSPVDVVQACKVKKKYDKKSPCNQEQVGEMSKHPK